MGKTAIELAESQLKYAEALAEFKHEYHQAHGKGMDKIVPFAKQLLMLTPMLEELGFEYVGTCEYSTFEKPIYKDGHRVGACNGEVRIGIDVHKDFSSTTPVIFIRSKRMKMVIDIADARDIDFNLKNQIKAVVEALF